MGVAKRTPLLSNVSLERRAWNIRRKALLMGKVQGQGYIGQAPGISDVLAASCFHAMDYRAEDPEWEGRDRFYLSIGHYAIALYAVLNHPGFAGGSTFRARWSYDEQDRQQVFVGGASGCHSSGSGARAFLPPGSGFVDGAEDWLQ